MARACLKSTETPDCGTTFKILLTHDIITYNPTRIATGLSLLCYRNYEFKICCNISPLLFI